MINKLSLLCFKIISDQPPTPPHPAPFSRTFLTFTLLLGSSVLTAEFSEYPPFEQGSGVSALSRPKLQLHVANSLLPSCVSSFKSSLKLSLFQNFFFSPNALRCLHLYQGVCVCARARVCVCVCVHARACVCACVCVYVRARVRMFAYLNL